VGNKGVGKGMGPWEKKGLKMIGIMMIREKRGIQWDRSQIMVWEGPNFFFLLLQSYTLT
jgi:hypothetical protein